MEENYEDIVTRHRKEKKELQAKIQSLKKTATKGDKKKRKEVADEIMKLENELEKKHNDELVGHNSVNPNNGEAKSCCDGVEEICLEDEAEADGDSSGGGGGGEEGGPTGNSKSAGGGRVTKAARRREKKAAAVKERELRICEQDAENVYGSRAVELKTIKDLLKGRGLMIYEIPSDGNCLYSAVDHQLEQVTGEGVGTEKLRQLTAEVLRSNANEYLPFLSHPDTGEILTPAQYLSYCDQVADTPAWGGQVELGALCVALKRCVEVIQAEGPILRLGEEFLETSRPSLVLTYHRQLYSLGEHYNSTQPYLPQPGQDEEEEPQILT